MKQNRVLLGEYVTEYSVKNKANEDIPVYSVTNSQGFCTEYFDKEVASKDKTTYKIVPRGYFAYNPSRINVGSVDWQKSADRVIVSPLYNVFSVSDELDQQYLFYFLKSDIGRQMIKAKSSGSVRDNLKMDMLKEMTIPKRTLQEQKECVAILDKLKRIISLQEEKIEKYDKLVKARFVEMFGDPVANEMGWDTLPLENACKAIVDCPHSTPSYTKEDTGFRCIRTSIVKKNRILWDEIEYIPEDEYVKRIQRKKPDVGDIVYTREGAILGIAAIIDRNCNVALGQRSMLLSPNIDKCASEFLCVAMNSDSFLDNALKGVSGSASPHINVGDIKAFRMIMPPIELQNQFSDFTQAIDKSKVAVQKALDKAQLLFDSLMQQYFG
ncbi:restriction endonuclease subunit S [Fusicatenibacter faecihominis]|uniref:Restriction endonuclease subunit S n=1 Tax=Fusicatenibacter faecihominis TaxID=2881276 RepID=A0AAE3J7T4_9FIRM|nr:restriction endonuclease subunit S [Fusicatenibacter faecihominis]MCC2191249.1 restriction endonuclease subunit S [Fusicatenibacter faecihominis]